MKIKLAFFCGVLFVPFLIAHEPEQIEKVYPLRDPIPAETSLGFLPTAEPGYSFEMGGEVFRVLVSLDKIRFEYENEWHSFEAVDHNPLTALVDGQTITFSNYWNECDLSIESRPTGLKSNIILKSDLSPKSFSFRIEHSAGWNDLWIGQPAIFTDDWLHPWGIADQEWDGDVLTYRIPETLPAVGYPLIIDPTYELSNSVDDTFGSQGAGDTNWYTQPNANFGNLNYFGCYNERSFYRWTVDIPANSTILTSKIHLRCQATTSGTVQNVRIYGLSMASSPAWQDANGFSTTNYSNGTALEGISLLSSYTSWATVPAWTGGIWYDTPDISTTLQEIVDDANYSTSDEIGFKITNGDGACAGLGSARFASTYDQGSSYSAELIVTYNPPAAGAQAIITVRRLLLLAAVIAFVLRSRLYR